MKQKFNLEIGGKKLEVEIRSLADRANGEVLVRYGDTQILTTCVMSLQDLEGLSFFPLTVNYEERYYATGKILGSRYIRREGKPSDNATLISRLIDRTIRPLFNPELKREVQVIATCLSWDEENDPDLLGLWGASLALGISDIPWQGPMAAVRIGLKNGELILNPTYEQREEALLDIVWTGILNEKKEVLINMIEASANEIDEATILKSWDLAKSEIKKLIEFQQEIIKTVGREKINLPTNGQEPELEKKVEKFLDNKIEQILFDGKDSSSKQTLERSQRLDELREELLNMIREQEPEKENLARAFFEKQVEQIVRQKILKEETRIGGRGLDEIREIEAEVGLIPRAHGSGLFCRGTTKSLSILTLGGPGDQQLIEGMEVAGKRRFLHHYNFPPYSVGEVKPLRSPSRREIGHGILAEKALFPLIPDFDDFPYTIRIVSEMLSSNGSTSMASVCSSSLSLMDAGVPIRRPVAGIALGLITEGENHKLLTDIQGPEDSHGEMDFKIAGSEQGITALQMDIKIKGINEQILKESLSKGREARLQILASMEKVLAKPRPKLSPFAPKIFRLQIPTEKIGEVIGPKGHTIKGIVEKTGAEIDIEEEGIVFITARDETAAKKAVGIIKNITREIKVGETFSGRVKRLVNFGAFLELCPGQEGLLHVSEFNQKKIKMRDEIRVKVNSIDEFGRINLSLDEPETKKSFKKIERRYGSRRKS